MPYDRHAKNSIPGSNPRMSVFLAIAAEFPSQVSQYRLSGESASLISFAIRSWRRAFSAVY
jgi:hypothetical protein